MGIASWREQRTELVFPHLENKLEKVQRINDCGLFTPTDQSGTQLLN